MDPATPTGETPVPVAPSNGPSTVAAPVTDTSNADVEAAKKQAQQAEMRANQLQNELDKAKAEKEAADRKKLEEKEEYKTLWETSQSKLKEIEDATAASVRQDELKSATQDVYKDYPENIVTLAKTAGLSLTDDSDEAVKALREKLDTFKSTVGSPTPSANNPRPVSPDAASREELLQRMRGGDKSAVLAYIRENPGVKRMKEIAQNGA